MSAQVYADGALVEEWDDTTRTHTDYTTDPPTVRDYTQAENDAADQRLTNEARLDDHEQRIAALETAVFPPDPDPTPGEPIDAPTWDDLGGLWPHGTLLADGGKVWRNIAGVPLTTPPTGFPGDPAQWTHLFIEVTTEPDPEPDPERPPWSPDSVAYQVGDEVTDSGRAYRCAQPHTSQPGWNPAAVPALWTDLGPA